MRTILLILLTALTATAQTYDSPQSILYARTLQAAGYTLRAKDILMLRTIATRFTLNGSVGGKTFVDLTGTVLAHNPIIGNTATSHAIDYVTLGTSTFAGTPTQNDGNIALNGSTQYMITDVLRVAYPQNSVHFTYSTLTSSAACACGEVFVGTTLLADVMRLNYTGGNFFATLGTNPSTSTSQVSVGTNDVFTITRNNATQVSIYKGGAAYSVNPFSNSSTGLPVGAINYGGTATGFLGNKSNRAIYGTTSGLTVSAAQALAINNLLKDEIAIK